VPCTVREEIRYECIKLLGDVDRAKKELRLLKEVVEDVVEDPVGD
jgi:hypothetical protein